MIKLSEIEQLSETNISIDNKQIIGKGNFGYVLKSKYRLNNEMIDCAVKVVEIKRSEIREILLEIEIQKNLNHKNIVEFYDCYQLNSQLYICMELCLSTVDRLTIKLTEQIISYILCQVLNALDYLHSTGIIHRDIKSANLLVASDCTIKLSDFGVSSVKEHARSFIGTPYWLAPEVILSQHNSQNYYNSKVDIWSLGITAIEMYDKQPPFVELHPMAALKIIPTVNITTKTKCSSLFSDFIKHCLSKDPSKRPTATQILQHPFITQHYTNNNLLQEFVIHLPSSQNIEINVKRQFKQLPLHPGTLSFSFSVAIKCICFYQNYLIVGNDSNLFSFNVHSGELKTLVKGVKFKELHCVPYLHLLLALAGKHSHIRSYSLTELLNDDISAFVKLPKSKLTKHFVVSSTLHNTTIAPFVVSFNSNHILCFMYSTLYEKYLLLRELWIPLLPIYVYPIVHCDIGYSISKIFVVYEQESHTIDFEDGKIHDLSCPDKQNMYKSCLQLDGSSYVDDGSILSGFMSERVDATVGRGESGSVVLFKENGRIVIIDEGDLTGVGIEVPISDGKGQVVYWDGKTGTMGLLEGGVLRRLLVSKEGVEEMGRMELKGKVISGFVERKEWIAVDESGKVRAIAMDTAN